MLRTNEIDKEREVNKETIELAYRLILGREPENESVINSHLNVPTLKELRKNMMNCEEFKQNFSSNCVSKKNEDVEKIRHICDISKEVQEDVFIDHLGVKVSPKYCSWISGLVGTRFSSLPFPDDGYFADAIEYVSLALSYEMAPEKDSFTVVEIGAGWGPWVSAATLVAKRLGYKKVNLIAFEADLDRYNAMRSHLDLNKIVPLEAHSEGCSWGLEWKLFNSAAHYEDTILYWPETGGVSDAGMATVASPNITKDYRGNQTTYKSISASDIRLKLKKFPVVNFVHIDIQGSEYELIKGTLDFFEKNVRCVFIATHSRKIEGDLIEELRARGWQLIKEQPCEFNPSLENPNLLGLTYKDGGQFWVTPASAKLIV